MTPHPAGWACAGEPPTPRQLPRRLMHVITGLSVGGAERNLVRLLDTATFRRIETTVVTLLDGGGLVEDARQTGARVVSLGLAPGRPHPSAVARLRRLIGRHDPDGVMTWMYHADLLGTLAFWSQAATRLVWNLRASDMDMTRYRALSGFTRWACARLSGRPASIIANSHHGRLCHERLGYRPRRWHVIPNGIDTSETYRPRPDLRQAQRRQLGLGDDDVAVGMVARVDPMKDHATFLSAMRQVAARHDRVRVVLAGAGTEGGGGGLTVPAALEDRTVRLGTVTDVAALMNALDLVVSSSSFGEGFPNVVAEAMACGVPCVVTDAGDARRIVGDEGDVVAPCDPAALAGAVDRMVSSSPAARQRRGARARQRICDHYDIGIMEQAYAAVLAQFPAREALGR